MILALVVAARSQDLRAEILKLPDTGIIMGKYRMEITLSVESIAAEERFLKDAGERFWSACQELEALISSIHCVQANQNLATRMGEILGKNNYIKKFIGVGKRTRSVWSALGAMDTDDRTRLDYDLDKLRGNEEELKRDLDHQANVLGATYELVNSSVVNMDANLVEMNSKFEGLRREVAESANFTRHVRRMVVLEAKLLEMSFWLNNLSQGLNRKLDAVIATLTYRSTGYGILEKLFTANVLQEKLETLASTLREGVSFPYDRNGQLILEALGSTTFRYEIQGAGGLNLEFQLPLMKTKKFEAYRVVIPPRIVNSTILISHIDEDVILFREDSYGGTRFPMKNMQSVLRLGMSLYAIWKRHWRIYARARNVLRK